MADEHVMYLDHDFLGTTYDVGCSCGWDRSGYGSRRAAVDDWENHCDVVFMEATRG